MEKKLSILGGICVMVILTAVYLFGRVGGINEPQSFAGAVDVSSARESTTTDTTLAGGTGTGFTVLASGPGMLGNVVITLGSASPLELYDGTTTDHRDRASTTLMKFKTTATAGTYTCDCRYNLGLILATPTSVGIASSTITWLK